MYIYILCMYIDSLSPSQVPGVQMKPVMKARGLHIDMACLGGIDDMSLAANICTYALFTLLQVMIALEPHRILLMSS